VLQALFQALGHRGRGLAIVNAFHVIGALFALWAVTLAALGITREDFPRGGRQTLAIGTVSVLLAVSAIGSAIITSALEEEEEEETGQPVATERGGTRAGSSGSTGRRWRHVPVRSSS
jgi:NADH:ubiquinone oxidoreductase subunit 6 (subunit J)